MTGFLTPHWEYPATVWCAHCLEPLELTMSSSVNPAATLHGECYKTQLKEKNK